MRERADADHALIETRGLGVCYWLRHKQTASLKHRLLRGALWSRPEVFWALRGVDLVCREGQAVGIVGANGAGKSTLCLALSGILQPDEGSVTVHGKVSSLLTLATGFDNQLTGRQNIFLSGAFLGLSQETIRSLADEVIEFSEMSRFIDEPVRTYSTGMRSRLAFAVATSVQPEILILDEILSVGDQAFQEKSKERILGLMASSKLVIIVSHNAELLRSLCSECLWLDEGRVRKAGPAMEVLDGYVDDQERRRGLA